MLKMSLMKDPFVATRAEEKPMELRRDSDWIRSRLYCTRLDTLREYDYVEYYMSNAFTSICPMIRFEFKHTFWMMMSHWTHTVTDSKSHAQVVAG